MRDNNHAESDDTDEEEHDPLGYRPYEP